MLAFLCLSHKPEYVFVPDFKVVVIYISSPAIIFLVITTLFAIIFKVLPDAIIQWRDAITGAMFTAILFTMGKIGITRTKSGG